MPNCRCGIHLFGEGSRRGLDFSGLEIEFSKQRGLVRGPFLARVRGLPHRVPVLIPTALILGSRRSWPKILSATTFSPRTRFAASCARCWPEVAKTGLPGDHHFYITFETRAPGVRVSTRLMTDYPEEMTIIIQHQYWDLSVTEHAFEIGLSFKGVPERLLVPFTALEVLCRSVGPVRPAVRDGRGRRGRAGRQPRDGGRRYVAARARYAGSCRRGARRAFPRSRPPRSCVSTRSARRANPSLTFPERRRASG